MSTVLPSLDLSVWTRQLLTILVIEAELRS